MLVVGIELRALRGPLMPRTADMVFGRRRRFPQPTFCDCPDELYLELLSPPPLPRQDHFEWSAHVAGEVFRDIGRHSRIGKQEGRDLVDPQFLHACAVPYL